MFDSLIAAIQNSVAPKIVTGQNGTEFCLSSGKLVLLPHRQVQTLGISSLTGLIDYMEKLSIEYGEDKLHAITIVSPTEITVVSEYDPDQGFRDIPCAVTIEDSSFPFGRYLPREEFQVKLASLFTPEGDRDKLITFVGKLTDENVRQTDDDGITQRVTVRQGVAGTKNSEVDPIQSLAPYRTFREVKQPASDFLFRMKSTSDGIQCALFEADGGMWKHEAIASIKTYLAEQLPDDTVILA